MKHSGLYLEEVDFGMSEKVWFILIWGWSKVVQADTATIPLGEVSGHWFHWAPVRLLYPPRLSFLGVDSLFLLWLSPPPVNNISTPLGIMYLDLILSSCWFSLLPLRVENSLWVSLRSCSVISFLPPHAMESHESSKWPPWEIKIHLLSSGSWHLRVPW